MQNAAEKTADAATSMIENLRSSGQVAGVASIALTIVVIVALLVCISSVLTREQRICAQMNKLYASSPPSETGTSIGSRYQFPEEPCGPKPSDHAFGLKDFYIKAAYNCCSAGGFKNSFVSTCALVNCIRQGARFLDFEIYSVGGRAVVATSAAVPRNCKIKETFNSVLFQDAMSTVAEQAFNPEVTPLANDPLILYFRLKDRLCVDSLDAYTDMANVLAKTLGSENRLLDSLVYGNGFEDPDSNASQAIVDGHMCPITCLFGKAVILTDGLSPALLNCHGSVQTARGHKGPCAFYEYVNGHVGNGSIVSTTWPALAGSTTSPTDLTDKAKNALYICTPDPSSPSPTNPNFLACKAMGIQVVPMCFQEFDSMMEVCDLYFSGKSETGDATNDGNAGGFIFKEASKRATSVLTVVTPTPNTDVTAVMKSQGPVLGKTYYS